MSNLEDITNWLKGNKPDTEGAQAIQKPPLSLNPNETQSDRDYMTLYNLGHQQWLDRNFPQPSQLPPNNVEKNRDLIDENAKAYDLGNRIKDLYNNQQKWWYGDYFKTPDIKAAEKVKDVTPIWNAIKPLINNYGSAPLTNKNDSVPSPTWGGVWNRRT